MPLSCAIEAMFEIGAHHDVHGLAEEAGDRTQLGHRRLDEGAEAVEGGVGEVGLGEAGFELARLDAGEVLERARGRLRDRDQPRHAAAAALVAGPRTRRARDRTRDHAADGEIGAARGARADAEEMQRLRLAALLGSPRGDGIGQGENGDDAGQKC